jgi:hypothetical protein
VDLLTPSQQSAPTQLRAMTMVTRAALSGLAQRQRAMLDAVQQLILETDVDVDIGIGIEPSNQRPTTNDQRQTKTDKRQTTNDNRQPKSWWPMSKIQPGHDS